jgi:hypothetical protein
MRNMNLSSEPFHNIRNDHIKQGWTNFQKMWELPKISRHQNGDKASSIPTIQNLVT